MQEEIVPKSFEPVKEMLLQKVVDLFATAKLSTALPEMLNPVQACILQFKKKTLLYLASL